MKHLTFPGAWLCLCLGLLLAGCNAGSKVAYKELLNEDPAVRADAVRKLGESRVAEALPSLLEMLNDPSEEVRVMTLIALADFGDTSVFPDLMPLTDDPMDAVRLQLAYTCFRFADSAGIEALEKLMYDPDETIRVATARALGVIDDPKALQLLLDYALQDESETVRQHVIKVIGERDYREAIPRLEDALTAEADVVRSNAAMVLGQIGDSSSLPVMLVALEDPFYKVRSLIAHAIKEHADNGDAEVLERLHAALSVEEVQIVKVDMAWALAGLGDDSKVDTIRDLLVTGDPEDVRAEAAMALGDIGTAADLPLLEKAIRDKKGLVGREAALAAQKLKEA